MGKVLPFQKKPDRVDVKSVKLLHVADEIDRVILECLKSPDIEPHDIAGILSHRLGTMMRHMDGKSELWDVCERVLKKQAALD